MEVSGRQESASRRTRLWHATRWPRSSEPEIGLRRARPPRLAPAQHGLPCGTDTLTHSNVMTSSKSHLPCPSTFLPPLFITSHETRARSSVRRRRSRSKRSGPFVFARGWKTGCKNSPSSICRRLFGANTLKLLMRRLLRLISAFYRPAYSHFRPVSVTRQRQVGRHPVYWRGTDRGPECPARIYPVASNRPSPRTERSAAWCNRAHGR